MGYLDFISLCLMIWEGKEFLSGQNLPHNGPFSNPHRYKELVVQIVWIGWAFNGLWWHLHF